METKKPIEKIVTIENKADEKFLRTKTASFDFSTRPNGDKIWRTTAGREFTKKEIQELTDKMKRTMKAANGIGLSANQIGLDMQFFVAQTPNANQKNYSAPKFYAIFNPKLEKPSKEKDTTEEGCLSVPGIWGPVERPEKVTLTGFDKNQKPIKIKVIGLLARIFQHEVDHLNGILFIDKAKSLHKAEPTESENHKHEKI